ncbi:MAG TPA: cupin domain-containing protein [Thermodesulfobacteriota bacterium]|jgi:quercetin dioxygenase-like cupin family protein
MTKHSHSTKRIQELAASYSLGALGKRETKEFERLLKEDFVNCESALNSFRDVINMLGFSVTPITPSLNLKGRLFSLVRVESNLRDTNPQYHGFSVVRANEGEWKEIAKGVSLKRLFVDQERNYATALLRMSPGTSFPKHRHGDTEECYVIDGDIRMEGHLYKEGDYIRAEAGSIHEGIYSRNGCTLLILSSQRNEIIE